MLAATTHPGKGREGGEREKGGERERENKRDKDTYRTVVVRAGCLTGGGEGVGGRAQGLEESLRNGGRRGSPRRPAQDYAALDRALQLAHVSEDGGEIVTVGGRLLLLRHDAVS